MRCIVDIQTLSFVALPSFITLVKDTTSILPRDGIGARESAVGSKNLPIAEPEVELTMLGTLAGSGGFG